MTLKELIVDVFFGLIMLFIMVHIVNWLIPSLFLSWEIAMLVGFLCGILASAVVILCRLYRNEPNA